MKLMAFWNIEDGLYAVEDDVGQVVADGFASMEEAEQFARDYWTVQWERLVRAFAAEGKK
jgi:hypothetical protein